MSEAFRTWSLLRELRANTRMPHERLEALQSRLMREAVRHAASHVPFYRDYWREHGFDASLFRGRDDWHRIPIVEMSVAKQAARAGRLVDERVDTAQCTYLDSSGSSGQTTRIWKQPLEERVRRAAGLRIWFEHGFRWTDRTAQFQILKGPQLWAQKLGISRKTWISTKDPSDAQLAQFFAAEADVVVGTPTALRGLCRAILNAGGNAKLPRIVFAAGELGDDSTRAIVERVMGILPTSIYGQTEVGYVAFQCERRDVYHVQADTHHVEVLSRGHPAGAGELGRLVITDLRTRTMPFLRCDTGDLARAGSRSLCSCGRTLPVLDSLEGRARGVIVPDRGGVHTTRAIVNAIGRVAPLGSFRIAQQSGTACEFTFLASLDGATRRAAVYEFHVLTNYAFAITIREAEEFTSDGTGKTHTVESAIVPEELTAIAVPPPPA